MNKRTFLKAGAILTTAFVSQPWQLWAQPEVPIDPDDDDTPWRNIPQRTKEFTLPALLYAVDALEPHFDKMTMEIHHGKHHATYIKNLNEAVKNTPSASQTLEQILANVTEKLPIIRNNAGGHYNHSLFWTLLKPNGGGAPTGKLAEEINAGFGSFDKFKETFTKAATSRFGSGWAWLSVDKKQKLFISSTPNQDNPLMSKLVKEKGIPILGLDVWEHAYYLKYQNKRADYINAFWQVVNWDEVARRRDLVKK